LLGARLLHVLDRRIHSHRAEDPAGNGIEEGLGDLRVGQARRTPLVARPHRGPERALHAALLQDIAHIGDRPVDVDLVQREPLGRVGLRPGPIPLLEASAGPPGDLFEAHVVSLVGTLNGAHRVDLGFAFVAEPSRPDQIERQLATASGHFSSCVRKDFFS
jgi:hypothetical protein